MLQTSKLALSYSKLSQEIVVGICLKIDLLLSIMWFANDVRKIQSVQ